MSGFFSECFVIIYPVVQIIQEMKIKNGTLLRRQLLLLTNETGQDTQFTYCIRTDRIMKCLTE